MRNIIHVAAFALAVTTAQAASPSVERNYAKCLQALIAAKGKVYAINHAGSTSCDRAAARGK